MSEPVAVTARTYICDRCGKVFESGWSEEEAHAEAEAAFTPAELAETAVVCDGCYQLLTGG
jgi:hypothetical protein